MSAAVKLALTAVFCAVACMLVKKSEPQMAAACAMGAGALILAGMLPQIREVIEAMGELGGAGAAQGYVAMAVKLLGVSYVCEFASQACRDAGEESMAKKVELGARVTLVAMTLPVAGSILAIVEGMLP